VKGGGALLLLCFVVEKVRRVADRFRGLVFASFASFCGDGRSLTCDKRLMSVIFCRIA